MAAALDQASRDSRNFALALRFALRELRGGLRGFYVFIACIALGVMAIAGVGSVAAGLADGLAREGRVILGGDLAFSLSLREASADERAFLDRRGRVSLAATLRAMARAARRAHARWSRSRRWTPPIRSTARSRSIRRSRSPRCWRSATAPSAPPPIPRCWRGSISSRARASRSAPPPIEIRAALTSEPDKLAGGIGFGPRLLISEAALRATGLLQPGSLVRWHYRLRLPDNDATDTGVRAVTAAAQAQLPEAGWEVRIAQQCLARARTQRRALHAVSHPGRPDRAAGRRRRRRQRGQGPSRPPPRRDRHAEGAGRDRRARVRDLSDPGAGARRARRAAGPRRRRRPAVSDRLGLRRRAAAADRAGACIRASSRWRCSTGS